MPNLCFDFFFLLKCEQFECKPPQPTQVVKSTIKLLGPDVENCLRTEDEVPVVVPGNRLIMNRFALTVCDLAPAIRAIIRNYF